MRDRAWRLLVDAWSVARVSMLVFMSLKVCSEVNCASWAVNSVFSTGLSGSWNCSCLMSRLKKSPTSRSLEDDLVEPVDVLVVAPVDGCTQYGIFYRGLYASTFHQAEEVQAPCPGPPAV
jgi:hypothetical protein